MKNIFNHRVISAFMVVVLSVSAFFVPVSASGLADTESVGQWDSRFNTVAMQISSIALSALCEFFGIPVESSPKSVAWATFDTAITNSGTGEVSLDRLYDICAVYNGYFNKPVEQSLFSFGTYASNLHGNVVASLLGIPAVNFTVEAHPSSGLYRIREKSTGFWVVNSSGLYPYCEGSSGVATSGGNQWVGERSCSTAKTNMKNLDTLNLLCNKIKESGTPCQIRALGAQYKAIWYNYQYYCDPEGRPFVCYANESQAAVNQDRPDTSVTDEDGKPATDETGTTINNPDNSTNIDLSGMTITLPDGTVQVADAVIYDESTKTYNIDSHDTTNNNYTYNYSWTYNINYTSITYIGTTAEYDKYYKVYYELPDGRDSADLTAADLEQLDFGIDVVNYGRSADDTSLRSLYHFDGDTRDSSYWNYCTGFKWNSGASLTYMDAGVFNGALYLDENAHSFTFTLPSITGQDAWTMSFRYYQSKTLAPQTDSSITFAGITNTTLMKFTGGQFLNGSGGVLATTPTGSWNEITIERMGNTLYYFLNGVMIGTAPITASLLKNITFSFGASQQTYKYFDEFRFVNKPLYSSSYTCPSVPFDTNLSLVLPDSVRPVADEYWQFDSTITPLYSYNFVGLTSAPAFTFQDTSINTTITADCITFSNTNGMALFAGFDAINNLTTTYDNRICTFALVGTDGTIYSATLDPVNGNVNRVYFDWGHIEIAVINPNGTYKYSVYIYLNGKTSKSFVYAEFLKGTQCNTGHKFITSITPVTSYTKPTLAVRTDISITSKQIGGPRPSLPSKGMVWALVEDGVIQSIQIYNGSAWESCDGRIFTGSRWIPYSAYNIITMKDFYDVADASGGSYEYIYTESGFWAWWQKSWNAFTNKLFAALSSAGMDTSGGTSSDGSSKSLWQRIKDAFNDTLGALIEALFDLIKEVLKTLISSATDMLKFFFGLLTDAVLGVFKSFFDAFKDNSLFDFFKQPPIVGSDGTQTDGGYGLPSEVGTGFAFISGVIMVLPPDLRSILFFGLAAMVLLGILKMVKA